jgi:hypothetical protein
MLCCQPAGMRACDAWYQSSEARWTLPPKSTEGLVLVYPSFLKQAESDVKCWHARFQ